MSQPTKKKNYTEKFQELAKAANDMGETRDCAVKALAIVGDLSYEDAHCLLELYGRKSRDGTYDYITHKALKFLDLATEDQTKLWRDCMGGRTVRTLARVMRGRKGKWLVWTSQHILAVEDGEVHDWTNGRLHRVKRILKVKHATAASNERP